MSSKFPVALESSLVPTYYRFPHGGRDMKPEDATYMIHL